MPSRWWGTPKNNFANWKEYQWIVKLQFGHTNTCITEKYTGKENLRKHLAQWMNAWGEEQQEEWVYIFYHALDIIPMNLYLETKL